MSKTAVIAKFTSKPGERAELRAALEGMLPTVEGEEGTEVYAIHDDLGDENVVWLYELYTDDTALAVHSSSDALKELIGSFADLLGAAPELNLAQLAGGKGLGA